MAGNMPAVFKYFILPEKIPDDGNVRAKCTLCVSYISGNIQRTSNLITHLKRLHPKSADELKQKPSGPVEQCDPKYQMSSRKHLSGKLLHDKSVEIVSNLKHKLSLATSVCLTIDIWTYRQMCSKLDSKGA
ncbi:uncharacterized protein LOC132723658 [Ruditapes philippinarum]|uniref:uncharacterized protein LOC132723658 n=1 Tax=Ruditapes philippinarum TaxID=129788 RepID=UPI00295BA118|nr:uncharacterized protein LOC132723658 [Ruditapes philippinarum]